MNMAKAFASKPIPLASILPAPRPDVIQVLAREDRTPRRRQRGEIYSTDDKGPPPRKMLRVASDAQLERYLGPTLFSALAGVRAAYHRLTAGMGMSSASYEARVNPGGYNPNRSSGDALADRWITWGQKCRAEGVNVGVVVDVVIMGDTPASVDRRNRKRHGWAVEQVKRGAEAWLSPRVRLAENKRKGPREG